jgi:hypothetical protein
MFGFVILYNHRASQLGLCDRQCLGLFTAGALKAFAETTGIVIGPLIAQLHLSHEEHVQDSHCLCKSQVYINLAALASKKPCISRLESEI